MADVKQVVLGGSIWTTIIGYVAALVVAADEVIQAGGLPTDAAGWKQLGVAVAIALFGRLTKQSNVTNAENPVDAKQLPLNAEKKE